MSFLRVISNFFFPQKKLVEVPIDPESIRSHQVVRAVTYENAELKGKVAKLEDYIGKLRESADDKKEEENIKIILNQKKKELELKSQGTVFSLRAFFGKFFRDKKFRESLGIYTFDRKERIANFGDIAIADNGDFVLLDKNGAMVLRMQRLKDLFQSVGALNVDFSRGAVPIWLDSDGAYIENIMEYEVPEIISTGDKLRFAKARKRPVYEIIQGLNDRIMELTNQTEEAEMINIDLQNKIDKLESSSKIHEQLSETSRSELTEKEERIVGIDKTFRTIQKDLVRSQNMNVMLEDEIGYLEVIKRRLKVKAERGEGNTSYDDAIDKIEAAKDLLKQKNIYPPWMAQQQSMPAEEIKK